MVRTIMAVPELEAGVINLVEALLSMAAISLLPVGIGLPESEAELIAIAAR